MTPVARRWGTSLFELAVEDGEEERILQELGLVVRCLDEDPDYLRLLGSPSLPKRERVGLLDEAFAGTHPYVGNFLALLCERGLLGELSGCARRFRELYNERLGIVEAHATSASPLSEDAQARLTQALEAMEGKKVELSVEVDPSVIGGLSVSVGGRTLDGTVRRRLELLRAGMAAAPA